MGNVFTILSGAPIAPNKYVLTFLILVAHGPRVTDTIDTGSCGPVPYWILCIQQVSCDGLPMSKK